MRIGLHIGLNYEGTTAALPDCIADANNLKNRCACERSLLYYHMSGKLFNDIIIELSKTTTNRDTIILTFSGHGTINGIGQNALVFHQQESRQLEYVSDSEIEKILSNLNCNVLFVIDACYAGGFARDLRNLEEGGIPRFVYAKQHLHRDYTTVTKNLTVRGGEVTELYACAENQVAYSTGTGGMFTRGLLSHPKPVVRARQGFLQAVKFCGTSQTPKAKGETLFNPILFRK
jgi:Caspase domain